MPRLAQRTKRTPIGGPRNILTVTNKDPNYFYRWVNDTPGRIDRFLQAGYEVVNHEAEVGEKTVDRASKLGSAVTMVRGSATLVLMRIPLEWYNEDQAAKQEEIDSLEASMRAEAEADYGILTINSRNQLLLP